MRELGCNQYVEAAKLVNGTYLVVAESIEVTP